jgi:hypothetical protein
MFHFGQRIIRVTFVDQPSGAVISTVRMPLERLPEAFAIDTRLAMAGESYLVVRAEPPTKPQFAATKQLTVFVRKSG